MKLKKNLILLTAILLLLSICNISAWSPVTHIEMLDRTLEDPFTSNLRTICEQHIQQCYCGLISTDFSVIYYLTQFENYRQTHSILYAEKLYDYAGSDVELQAFAVGARLHQVQDIISHNYFIPEMLDTYWYIGSNSFLHPLVEEKMDKQFDRNSALQNKLAHSLDCFEQGSKLKTDGTWDYSNNKYLKAMNSVTTVKWDSVVPIFKQIAQKDTFFDRGYTLAQDIPQRYYAILIGLIIAFSLMTFITFRFSTNKLKWLFILFFVLVVGVSIYILIALFNGTFYEQYRYLAKNIITAPISLTNSESFLTSVETISKEYLLGVKPGLDPTGEESLRNGQLKFTIFTTVLFIIMIVFIIAYFISYLSKRLKRKTL